MRWHGIVTTSKTNGGGTVHTNGAGTSPVFSMTNVRSAVSATGQSPKSSLSHHKYITVTTTSPLHHGTKVSLDGYTWRLYWRLYGGYA